MPGGASTCAKQQAPSMSADPMAALAWNPVSALRAGGFKYANV
jgi:hypothetical protein